MRKSSYHNLSKRSIRKSSHEEEDSSSMDPQPHSGSHREVSAIDRVGGKIAFNSNILKIPSESSTDLYRSSRVNDRGQTRSSSGTCSSISSKKLLIAASSSTIRNFSTFKSDHKRYSKDFFNINDQVSDMEQSHCGNLLFNKRQKIEGVQQSYPFSTYHTTHYFIKKEKRNKRRNVMTPFQYGY